MEEYSKIDFFGGSIEDAVKELKRLNRYGVKAYIEFNGHNLYSDTVTLDDAYKAITDMTYSEFKKMLEDNEEKRKLAEKEFQEKLPTYIDMWIKKGRDIFNGDRLALWEKIVPIRLNDLYHGMELGNCIDIVEALNKDCSFDEAKKIIEDQNHSGMSFGLVCSMVKEFSDRGSEFVKYVRY